MLHVFKLDPQTGATSPVQTIGAGEMATTISWIAIAPNERFLYANVEETSTAVAFKIDPATGMLTRLNEARPIVDSSLYRGEPVHLELDRAGKFLFQAHFQGGTVSIVPINVDGTLGTSFKMVNQGNGSYPGAVRVDPSNKFVFVLNRGGNHIAQFKWDAATGALTANTPPKTQEGTLRIGPRHLDFHPNGKFAYVVNEDGVSVTAYKLDAETGTLESIQNVTTKRPGITSQQPREIHVHPSGKFVYALDRFGGSITIYSVDPDTGLLKSTGALSLPGQPRNAAMDPHGRFLVVGTFTKGALNVLSIDGTGGALTALGAPTPLPLTASIALVYLPGK
jgi:6-phosphogluconolactonase